MIKSIIQYTKDKTRPLRKEIRLRKREFIKKYRVKKYAEMLFQEQLGYSIDWNNPKDLNEKINWLAFNTDTSEWSRLADKYLVREFVKERGCEEILIPLLGVWNNVDEIDLNMLPDEFVIKTNCGSGDVILVNKNNLEWGGVLCRIHNALNTKFGYETAEPHYMRIEPKIIAEQLLNPQNGGIVDYKIWCFNGEPFCVLTCSERDLITHTYRMNLYDTKWNCHKEWVAEAYRNKVGDVKKPKCLDQMLEYAAKLSIGFPQVRVDLYEVDNKIYFGEMTFTAACGRMTAYTNEILEDMGKSVILPKKAQCL